MEPKPKTITKETMPSVPAGPTKIIEVQRGINDQISGFKDRPIDYRKQVALDYDPLLEMTRREDSKFRMPLLEAFVTGPDAANMLRDGIRYIAFSTYQGLPNVWRQLVQEVTSTKPEEEYLRDAAMGVIPRNPSGQPVDYARSQFEGGTIIKNYLYRVGVMILGDDVKFDRLGKIRQIAAEMGRSAMVTEDWEFFKYITTTTNYSRNSTTNDNDVGANQATTTFNALGLDTGLTTISTAKDRFSRQYLGFAADTILTTPKMEFPVKQFLMSGDLMRQHGNTTAEVRGMGTFNPYEGLLNRIIISPWLGTSYQWALCDSRQFSYVWQWVDRWQIMQEGMVETSEAWLTLNALRYVIAGYFGHGFVDDRAWFFSDSTTAPTVS